MKDFVTYEKALELKELGFDEPCFKVYDTMGYVQDEQTMLNMRLDYCSAPTFSQAFRFFREKCDWQIETWIQPYLSINPRTYEGLYWRRGETESVGIYDTYEEAELACLIKLIEIVKTKQP